MWEYLIVDLFADAGEDRKSYEYFSLDSGDLDGFGAEGWELVAVAYKRAFFKRLARKRSKP